MKQSAGRQINNIDIYPQELFGAYLPQLYHDAGDEHLESVSILWFPAHCMSINTISLFSHCLMSAIYTLFLSCISTFVSLPHPPDKSLYNQLYSCNNSRITLMSIAKFRLAPESSLPPEVMPITSP